jgi:hypothetical protein
MRLNVSADLDDLKRKLSRVERDQLPFATSMAINNVAVDVANAITKQMERYLDNPTPFTLKAYQSRLGTFKGKRATKKSLVAIIEPGQIQAEYLKFQIAGGVRTPKQSMILVPTKQSPLNRYGNLSRANRKRLVDGKGKFFSVGRKENRTPAIYRRDPTGITPMAVYVQEATYKPILPIYKIANGVVSNQFPKRVREALRRAMATAR